MGYQERTIGGGPARELGKNFTDFLNQWITTGSFGGTTTGQQASAANPARDTSGIFGLLNSLVSNPQADASVQELISRDITRGRNDLRARFGAGGGMGFGTPAAFAEALYQAEQAPRTAIAMDEIARARMGALVPLFNALTQISSLGIPQAQAALQPDSWLQGLNVATQIANTAANFIPGGGGGSNVQAAPSFGPMPRSVSPVTDSGKLKGLEDWSRGYDPTLATGFRFMPLPTNQQLYR